MHEVRQKIRLGQRGVDEVSDMVSDDNIKNRKLNCMYGKINLYAIIFPHLLFSAGLIKSVTIPN